MLNTKLVNILRTFSKNEMTEFEKFICSPYFNKGRNYLPFLNELKRFYPKFDNDKMTQEFVFSKIYPGKKYNKQIIWNLTSGMLNMAESFLLIASLKKNQFIECYTLCREYYTRKLPKYLIKTIDEMESKLGHVGIEEDYFFRKFKLASLRKTYNYMQDRQHVVADQILEEGEYTVLFFLNNIAEYIVDMRSIFLYYNAGFDINMPYEFLKNINLSNVVNFVKDKDYRYSWIMEMFYLRMMLVLDFDNENHFHRLKALLIDNYNKFSSEINYNWIVSLSNYCIMKINKGIDFRRQLFEMNELNLKTGTVFPGRYLMKTLFLQVLRSALAVDEIEWSKNFIREYITKLKPSYQKPIEAFGYALLYFKTGDYNRVLENLAKVQFFDARDKIDVKIVYLKTYYELNEIEAVISMIDSTRHFINKSTSFTEISRINFTKSLNYLNKLINAKLDNDKDEMEEIRISLQKEKGVVLGKWILDKIEELKTKKAYSL